MRTFAASLAILALPAVLASQEPGDSVRVHLTSGAEPLHGRLIDYDDSSLQLHQFMRERSVPREEVGQVDVWKKGNLAGGMLLGIIGAVGTEVVLQQLDDESGHLTGSSAGDYAFAFGLGSVVGLATHLVWPGRWKKRDLQRNGPPTPSLADQPQEKPDCAPLTSAERWDAYWHPEIFEEWRKRCGGGG